MKNFETNPNFNAETRRPRRFAEKRRRAFFHVLLRGLRGSANLFCRIDGSSLCAYFFGMSTVAEIKAAIDKLTLEERCELEALLHPFEDDAWDRQMKRDAEPGGKLYRLMEASENEAKAGKLIDLPICDKQ